MLPILAAAARGDVLHVPGDFGTIQAAVTAALPGDEIVIAAGSYPESLDLDGKTDLRLRGKGQVIVSGNSPLLPVITVSGGSGVTLEKLRIGPAPNDGISLQSAVDVTLRHVRIESVGGRGVHVSGCEVVTIEHLDVTGAAEDGLRVEVTDGLSLRQAQFKEGGSEGVRILDGAGALVERVTVTGSGGSGFVFASDVVGATLRKCVVHGANPYAVEARATGLLIEDNRFLDGLNSGVALDGGAGIVVRRNRIVRPAIYGIFVSEGSHQLLDNRIVLPGQAGILATLAPGQLLADNRVQKSQQDGLVVGSGASDCTLLDNRVVAAEGDGLVVNAVDVLAAGNVVSGSGGVGLQVLSPGGVFTGNKVKGSAQLDLFDATGGGSTYVDNQFGTTDVP